MPDLDGLALQQALTAGGLQPAVIFLTGKGDIPTSVRAMRWAPSIFLTKPVNDADLLAAIGRAEKKIPKTCSASATLSSINARSEADAAGTRGHDPCDCRPAQQADSRRSRNRREDGEVDRGRVMDKLGVRSVADLVRLAEKAGITRMELVVARHAALLAFRPTRQSVAARPIVRHMAQPSPWIAIVDDDPSVLKALARLLRTRAVETRTYGSARDFLASLPNGMPDELPECLIVDLQMPDMTGLELQRQLNRAGIRIPTIVITAHDEADMRELCAAAGAETYLLKPLQDTALLAAINDVRAKTARTNTARTDSAGPEPE